MRPTLNNFLFALAITLVVTACTAPGTATTPGVVSIDAPAERILESQNAFLEFMNCAVTMAPEEGRPALQKIISEAEAIDEEAWKTENQKFASSAQLFTLEFGSKCTKTTSN